MSTRNVYDLADSIVQVSILLGMLRSYVSLDELQRLLQRFLLLIPSLD